VIRPYLAVIYDSFIDAAQSRVLWVLLVAWAVILCAIAPFGIMEGTSSEIRPEAIIGRPELIEELGAAADGQGTLAQQAVWAELAPKFQQRLVEYRKSSRGKRLSIGDLAEGMNSALEAKELYAEAAWPTAARRSELKEWLAVPSSQLGDLQRRQLNRRLIELAFPRTIRSGESQSLWIGYAGVKVSQPLPFTWKTAKPFFEGVVLMAVLKIGLGIVGLFIGIIVTSSLIPDMFQAGSLHLLLSKPISRSWLLIAKYLGGTCFVLLNVSFLLLGFFILVGVRLGIWNDGLLGCIPIFLFVFMIYYSISMLAGLIWRNAIVAIVLTCLFWGVCTALGITYKVMQAIVTEWPEITAIQPVGEQVFSVTKRGRLRLWEPKERQWQMAFGEPSSEAAVLGPFWLAEQGVLYFGRPERLGFGGLQSDGIPSLVAALPELQLPESVADAVPAASLDNPLWSERRLDIGPDFPSRTRRVMTWRDSLVALTERGIYRLDLKSIADTERKRQPLSFFGLGESGPFVRMTPEDWQPAPPMDFASTPANQMLVYTRGRLVRLEQEESLRYRIADEKDLELPEGTLALVSCLSQSCLVATQKAGVMHVDLGQWSAPVAIPELRDCIPRELKPSGSDNSFLLLDRDRYLWRISADGKEVAQPDLPFQGHISSITIADDGDWWLAHHVHQVTRWNPRENKPVLEIRPTFGWVEQLFYWVVKPMYVINPKPSAFDSAIQRALTGDEPLMMGRDTNELEQLPVDRTDLWLALGSNTLFIAVMLAGGCWYLHRQDL
jgi:hypothetical protein